MRSRARFARVWAYRLRRRLGSEACSACSALCWPWPGLDIREGSMVFGELRLYVCLILVESYGGTA